MISGHPRMAYAADSRMTAAVLRLLLGTRTFEPSYTPADQPTFGDSAPFTVCSASHV